MARLSYSRGKSDDVDDGSRGEIERLGFEGFK
jgi:hypothetical protein